MIYLPIFVCLFANMAFGFFDQTNSDPTTCVCGLTNGNKKRITGGSSTTPHEYPFMLSLVVRNTHAPICGAAVLSQNYAITAAHCTHGLRVPLSVLAGVYSEHTRDSSVQESFVKTVVEHEKYAILGDTVLNDIAILVLQTPLKLNSFVLPICMPTTKINVEGQMIKIMGWGLTGPTGQGSDVLLQTDLRGIRLTQCAASSTFRVQAGMHLCTQKIGTSACKGDSGGPAVWLDPSINRYTLVGLVSFSPPGCTKGNPVVLTDIYTYTPWIYLKTREHMCRKL